MSRRRGTPDDEVSLFRQALQEAGVQRLFSDRSDPGTPRRDDPQRLAARRDAAVSAATDAGPSRTSDGRVEPVRPSSPLDFAVPDLPYRTHSALKRGRIAWEAGLDLHGYTLEEAREQLEQFLHDARHQRQRCVLVEIPKTVCGAYEFHRANALICLGRHLAAQALDRYERPGCGHAQGGQAMVSEPATGKPAN